MVEWLNPFGSTPDPSPFSEPKVETVKTEGIPLEFTKTAETEKKEVLAAAPPVEEVKPVELSEEEKVKEAKKKEIHDKIVKCLAEHNNLESDIPRSHEYWTWLNQYRGLNSRP